MNSQTTESRKKIVFLIPVNESDDGGSVTVMRIDCGAVTMRTAKRKLRIVLKEWGIPAYLLKRFVKELTSD